MSGGILAALGSMAVITAISSRRGSRVQAPDFDQCKERAMAETRRMRELGLDARFVQVADFVAPIPGTGVDERWLKIPPSSWRHYLVELEGNVIDYAPRQFRLDAVDIEFGDAASFYAKWGRRYDITDSLYPQQRLVGEGFRKQPEEDWREAVERRYPGLLDAILNRMPNAQISAQYGISMSTVSMYAKKLGVSRPVGRPRKDPETTEAILEALRAGESPAEIASRLLVPASKVRAAQAILRKTSKERAERRYTREENQRYAADLEGRFPGMVMALQEGDSLVSVARRYGLSPSYISQIVKRLEL